MLQRVYFVLRVKMWDWYDWR